MNNSYITVIRDHSREKMKHDQTLLYRFWARQVTNSAQYFLGFHIYKGQNSKQLAQHSGNALENKTKDHITIGKKTPEMKMWGFKDKCFL